MKHFTMFLKIAQLFKLFATGVVLGVLFASIILVSTGCSTEHKIKAEGETKVRTILEVDLLKSCEPIVDEAARLECYQLVLEMMEAYIQEKKLQEGGE